MPFPKNLLRDPVALCAWMAERQDKLDEFDRLTATGLSGRQAARAVGLSSTGVRQMRACLARLADPDEERLTGHAASNRIDLGLALLSVANPGGDPDRPREALTARDIAAWCGCSHAAIQSIERRALRKVHRQLNALLREQVITGDFGDESPAALAFAA